MAKRGRRTRLLRDETRLRGAGFSTEAQAQIGQMFAVLYEATRRGARSLPEGFEIPEPLGTELQKKGETQGRQKEVLGH